jgi:uncharacterized protein YyaL (SSP411 family)
MMQNRLKDAASPYLLQHKDNPVHWQMWGEDALEAARTSGKPILLSIGYAACHWCHVMAHESFEDDGVAAIMNALFINIKVDREERPDVDQVYMAALHALGQPGGWPLTMFLTPQGEPFWGGTYFPKETRYGRKGFPDILREVSRVFHAQPEQVATNATALRNAVTQVQVATDAKDITQGDLTFYAERITAAMDPVNGGLKGAPKFPNPPALELLWRAGRGGEPAGARDAVLLTLRRMCEGGIYDHLGGGFARYSVDDRWLVPHFEKMLYDNAQLLDLLALAWRETKDPLFAQAARDTVGWLLREMRTEGGAFSASLDADSEGVEGKFYVWTYDEIETVLGVNDAAFFGRFYDATPEGNWQDEHHGGPRVIILNRLLSPPADAAEDTLTGLRARLFEARATRVRPGLDDKILADWNGLTIAALVHAGLIFQEASWIEAARAAFDFVASKMVRVVDGQPRLGHAWRAGSLVFPGMASDYAAMMRAALALAEADRSGDADRLIVFARDLAAALDAHHYDAESGTFFMSADDAPDVAMRTRPTADEAVPNAHAVLAQSMVKLAALTGDDAILTRADKLIQSLLPALRANAFGHAAVLNAIDQRLNAAEIALVGPDISLLKAAALALPFTDRHIHHGRASGLAEVAAYPVGQSAAFVCVDGRCSLPVTDPWQIEERVVSMQNRATGCT